MNFFYIDVLRVLAIFGVILIHASASLATIKIGDPNWDIATFYSSLGRFSVPIFLMISGALLLEKRESINKFIHKRFLKIIIPWIAWVIIYGIFKIFYLNIEITPLKFFELFLSGKMFFHLYYINLILGLYLSVPLLRVLVANAKLIFIFYYILLWLIFASILPLIYKIYHIKIQFYTIEYTGFLGFFLLGYFLHKLDIKKFTNYKLFISLCLIFITGFLIVFYGVEYYSLKMNKYISYFYGWKNIGVILMSISLFLLVKSIKIPKFRIIQLLSSYVFGIYLVHAMVMYILWKSFNFRANLLDISALYSIPAVFFLTLIFSTIIVYILKKIPFVKEITP